MEDDLKALLPEGSSVKLKSLGPLKGSGEPLIAELDVEMPSLGSFAGARVLLPLSIFTASTRNPFNTLLIDRSFYAHVQNFYKNVATADQDNLVLKKAAK